MDILSDAEQVRIGVISDTHGLLREEAVQALQGVDAIIHAGDIGKPHVIEGLQAIAPVIAVKGNVDRDGWAERYPETMTLKACGRSIFVLHNIAELDFDPAGRYNVVICGHSHIPKSETKNDILYFNPGSAGPRRFRLPVSLGILTLSQTGIEAMLKELEITPSLNA